MRAPMATASTRGDVQVAAEAPPATRHTPDSQSAPDVHAQPPSCPSAVESAQEGAPSKIVAEMVTKMPSPVWKSKFYGAFVLNLRVDLHAIDATPARRSGGAGSSPLY